MLSQQIGRLAASGLHTAVNISNSCSLWDTVKDKAYNLLSQFEGVIYGAGGVLFVVLVGMLMFHRNSGKRSGTLQWLGWVVAVVILLSISGTVYHQLTGGAACS